MKILDREIQFIIPIFLCCLLFLVTNILGLFDISELSYWSGLIENQCYRILSYPFVHKDLNHLLSNLFGIIVVRYCFFNLTLKNKYFFLYLVALLIPIKTILLFIFDKFLTNNNHLLVGFSGVLFGSYTFIVLASIFGKSRFINVFIGLKKNNEIKNLMTLFLSFGIIYSLFPSISLSGHVSGILGGFILFFL